MYIADRPKCNSDCKLYGVWIGELRIRTLTLADKGPEKLAWLLLEEAQHFSPDGIIFKSHPENKEKVFEQTNDYLKMVEHGAIFEQMIGTLCHLINDGQEIYPNFNNSLRSYSIQRTNNPEMKLLEDSVKYHDKRLNNIRFEKDYEITYMKSAPQTPQIPMDPK